MRPCLFDRVALGLPAVCSKWGLPRHQKGHDPCGRHTLPGFQQHGFPEGLQRPSGWRVLGLGAAALGHGRRHHRS
eukprot:12202958-Alexandrium_andersonii.AAC.1